MTRRQQLFVKIVTEQTRAISRGAVQSQQDDRCPNCGISGFNHKTGECSKPWQCCGNI